MKFRPINSLMRICLLIVDMVAAVGLLLSAYGGSVAPSTSVVPQLLGMTFPLWIVVGIVMLLLSLVVWRRLALLPAVALLAAMPSVLTIAPLRRERVLSADERDRCFTVMTYNVYGFTDYEYSKAGGGAATQRSSRSLQQVVAAKPDIVCLQEAYGLGRFKEQYDSIKAIYPYIGIHPASSEIMLSKYPIEAVATDHPDWRTAAYCAYQVDVEGRQLLVVNCHLQSIGLTPDDKDLYRELTDRRLESPTRSELSQVKNSIISKLADAFRQRAEQAQHIAQFLSAHPGNAILVGDFNDVQLNYAYRCMRNVGMRDAYADAGFGPTITYIDNRFYFHIDQIFYRGDLAAVAIERGRVRSSDHYPLTATFLWK